MSNGEILKVHVFAAVMTVTFSVVYRHRLMKVDTIQKLEKFQTESQKPAIMGDYKIDLNYNFKATGDLKEMFNFFGYRLLSFLSSTRKLIQTNSGINQL